MSGSPLDQPPPYPGIKSAFESSCDLVIGIDFGTTFTGVAYAHTGTAQSSSNAISIADKVVIIRAWPSASSHYAEKTPTVLSYNTSPPSWGGKVRPSDDPQVAHFKLGLQENVGDIISRRVRLRNLPCQGYSINVLLLRLQQMISLLRRRISLSRKDQVCWAAISRITTGNTPKCHT